MILLDAMSCSDLRRYAEDVVKTRLKRGLCKGYAKLTDCCDARIDLNDVVAATAGRTFADTCHFGNCGRTFWFIADTGDAI
jgi:hypothetical protein